jgi:hypothetical protein
MRREFACRAVSFLAPRLTLQAPGGGEIGEKVTAHIDRLGWLDGQILRVFERGFVMSIIAGDEKISEIKSRLSWLEKIAGNDFRNRRRHDRLCPGNPWSRLILANGNIAKCLVIDISPSGVSVSADILPEIGMVLAVGTVIGRVVRRFEEGFAVEFETPQNLTTLEAAVLHD